MNSNQINQARFSEIKNKRFQSSGMEFRITQRFNDPETDPKVKLIYTDYGRIGHDGLDIAVYGDVKAIEGGMVLFADWDTKITWATKGMFNGFGIMTIIWNKENNRFWLYAHLASNIGVEVGQQIKKGDYIGKMGGSGYGRQGEYDPHVHIGLYKVNETPTILDRDNGFWGGLDPLPFLIDNVPNTPPVPVIIQTPTQIPTTPITKPKGFETASPRYQQIFQNNDWVAVFSDFKDRDDEISNQKKKIKELEDSIAAINQTISELRETIGEKEGIITELNNSNHNLNLKIEELNKIISKIPESKQGSQTQNILPNNQIYSENKVIPKKKFVIEKEAIFGFIKNNLFTFGLVASYFGYKSSDDQILQMASVAAPFLAGFLTFVMEEIYKRQNQS